MKQVLAMGAIVACTLAVCTACVGSSTGSPSSNTGSANTSSTSSTSSSTTGSAATSSAATVTSVATAPATAISSKSGGSNSSTESSGPSTCLTRYLNGSIGTTQGAAGSVYVDVVFKNLDNKPCTLDGYPGVSFGAGTPVHQIGQPADRDPLVSPKLVTLQPGGHAYAVLQIGDAGNYPASTCKPAATTYLQVYPPNSSNLLYVAYDSTGCAGNVVTLHVEAVQPGTGG